MKMLSFLTVFLILGMILSYSQISMDSLITIQNQVLSDILVSDTVCFTKDSIEYHLNGEIARKTPYCGDKKHGHEITFDNLGNIESIVYYTRGIRTGQTLSFQDGLLWTFSTQRNGQGHGKGLFFWENMELQYKTYMIDGKHEGKTEAYDFNGKLIKTVWYQNDEIIKTEEYD